ncbi:toxin [Salmonella enterica]|nr:toxin [Salmonella enterica]
MKKNIIMLFFFTSILTGCGSSVNNERLVSLNPGEDISGAENGSLFSIRNIQSGFMITNILDQQGREQSGWELIQQETPIEVLATTPGGWIQFHDPITRQCLNAINGVALTKGTCDLKNRASLFVLIPSTTGAVQIQSVHSKTCIIDQDNTDHFLFGRCVADIQNPQQVVPEKNLWMLNPPVTASSMAPINI